MDITFTTDDINYACDNPDCRFYRQKKFPPSYTYCPGCAQPLVHVCHARTCYNVITDDPEAVYCESCQAERDQRNEKIKSDIDSAGAAIGSAVGSLAGFGSKFASNFTKSKRNREDK